MTKIERYKVGKEDWEKFTKMYEDKGYIWNDDEKLTAYNPFKDDDECFGNEEIVYIMLKTGKRVLFDFEDSLEEDAGLYARWTGGCYFCSGKREESYIKYLDKDGDLIQATANISSQGLTAGKVYLFTENKVIEAKFCPVCGDEIIE